MNVKIIKVIFGIFTGLLCFSGIILSFSYKPTYPFIIETIIFGLLTFLLLKPKKKETPPKTLRQSSIDIEFPKEVLDEIKSVSPSLSSEQYIRVINDSIKNMNETNNIETLLLRYEDSLRKAYTLKQMEQSGISKADADYYINHITSNRLKWIINCYNNFITDVKTDKGKENRKKKFVNTLEKYVDEYELKDILEVLK